MENGEPVTNEDDIDEETSTSDLFDNIGTAKQEVLNESISVLNGLMSAPDGDVAIDADDLATAS